MEKLLQELLQEIKEIKAQNKALAEQNQLLQQQIAELKENQTEEIKKLFKNAVKEELVKLIEIQIDKYLKDLQTKQDATIENQHEIAKFLELLQKELVNHIKESKESDKELLDKGDKILEVLDDIGNAVVKAHDGILENNNKWGKYVLERFDAISVGLMNLRQRIDDASEYVRENNDMTYKAVKDLESTIYRKSW